MKKDKTKFYVVQGLALMLISITVLGGYLIRQSLAQAEEIYEQNYTYVSYEILTDNIVPVSKEVTPTNKIKKPYTNENVKIGKNFYDIKGTEEEQKNAITYYEGTYIQNTGVDYVSKDSFEVSAVLNGKVVSVKKDDIVGLTIKIDHGNQTISTYQSLSEAKVKEGDEVKQGDMIGLSGTNKFNSDLGNHLHFELTYLNKTVNPEKYYDKTLGEVNE